MEKLEIKLTLTTVTTPNLLAYLSNFSSARDRAFVLKQLAEKAAEEGVQPFGNPKRVQAKPSPRQTSTKATKTKQPARRQAPRRKSAV